MDRMMPERQRGNHHIKSIVHSGEIRSCLEWSLADGGKEIISRQGEAKRWGLHPEPVLEVWNVVAVHLHADARGGAYSLVTKDTQICDLWAAGRLQRGILCVEDSDIEGSPEGHFTVAIDASVAARTVQCDELPAEEPYRARLPHAALGMNWTARPKIARPKTIATAVKRFIVFLFR